MIATALSNISLGEITANVASKYSSVNIILLLANLITSGCQCSKFGYQYKLWSTEMLQYCTRKVNALFIIFGFSLSIFLIALKIGSLSKVHSPYLNSRNYLQIIKKKKIRLSKVNELILVLSLNYRFVLVTDRNHNLYCIISAIMVNFQVVHQTQTPCEIGINLQPNIL